MVFVYAQPGIHGESHQIVAQLCDLKHVESRPWHGFPWEMPPWLVMDIEMDAMKPITK